MINDIKLLEDNIDEIAASPPITAFLHDLAGQNVYYDTHYYFLKLQCPYVVVHDLRIPFDSHAQPRFKPKLKAERNLENPFLASNLDYFLSWFTVLSSKYPVSPASLNLAGSVWLDSGYQLVDSGSHYLDSGSHYPDSGSYFLDSASHHLDSGSRYLDSRYPYLDSGSHKLYSSSHYLDSESHYANAVIGSYLYFFANTVFSLCWKV